MENKNKTYDKSNNKISLKTFQKLRFRIGVDYADTVSALSLTMQTRAHWALA